jgi:hypothetical protein
VIPPVGRQQQLTALTCFMNEGDQKLRPHHNRWRQHEPEPGTLLHG